MKYKLLSVLGFIALGWAVFAATSAEATTAAGPYYAPPAWDQTLQCDTQATCPRFIALSNFTETKLDPDRHKIIVSGVAVLDRETGLVWEQSPGTDISDWLDAQRRCNSLATGGRLGWRLPTIAELGSLVDPNVSTGPLLPAGHPFSNVQSSVYWSASTDAGNNIAVWVMDFDRGSVDPMVKVGGTGYVWCVRGGQGIDPHPAQ